MGSTREGGADDEVGADGAGSAESDFSASVVGATSVVGAAGVVGAADSTVTGRQRNVASAASLVVSGTVEVLVARAVLSADFGRRFIEHQILAALSPRESVCCPVCGVVAVAGDLRAKAAKPPAANATRVMCSFCRTAFCALCSRLFPLHSDLSCAAAAAEEESAAEAFSGAVIAASSKACPNCGIPTSHYRGHSCHHIAPPAGCPGCGYHYCIVCLEAHPCSLRGHGLYCDDRCDCPQCPDCQPGNPCAHCDGNELCHGCHPPPGSAAARAAANGDGGGGGAGAPAGPAAGAAGAVVEAVVGGAAGELWPEEIVHPPVGGPALPAGAAPAFLI